MGAFRKKIASRHLERLLVLEVGRKKIDLSGGSPKDYQRLSEKDRNRAPIWATISDLSFGFLRFIGVIKSSSRKFLKCSD